MLLSEFVSAKAVTFDFWETLYTQNPDIEAPRRAQRLELLSAFLLKHDKGLGIERISTVFSEAKKRVSRTSEKKERAYRLLDVVRSSAASLGLDVVKHYEELELLAENMDRVALQYPPLLMERATAAVQAFAEKVPVGLISNTGDTSGRTLRVIMARDGLLDFFSKCAFSDEVGLCKPDVAIFRHAARLLGANVQENIHVGNDMEADVQGAIDAGMQAIWLRSGSSFSSDTRFFTIETLDELVEMAKRLT